jgi:sporulation protein YlmC with PRC-barrel domain
MLQLSASLFNKPVLSLRTNTPVAQVSSALINPNNLKIEGFYCTDRFNGKSMILLYQDIREFMSQGYAVNDHDVLSEPEDLVRLADIIKINFELIGKPVVTISKEKIGKVSDYAVEIETMYIQKIYVAQSILKNFTGGSLSVDRNQINEVTDKRIILNDLLNKSPIAAPVAAI